MTAPNRQTNAQRVTARLTEAWAFLSGEQRIFERLEDGNDFLACAPYNFFMSLAEWGNARLGGVSVLIQADDGMQVAQHMFGKPLDQISDAEVRDACAETCNVFADCIARDLSANSSVDFSLPRPVSPEVYARIADNSLTKTVYQGVSGTQTLLIVLHDSLRVVPLEKE